MAIPSEVRAFAEWLGTQSPTDRLQLLQKAKLLAATTDDDGEVGPLIRTLEDYLAADIPVPPVLVHPFMCVRGGLNSTIGRSGKGKTVMNLNRLLRWSAGVPWFQDLVDAEGMPLLFPEKDLKILIVENEGAAGMFHRQIGIMTHAEGYLTDAERKLALKNVLVWKEGGYSSLKLDEEAKLNELRQGVEQWEPDLVYIEPLRSLWTGEENSSTDMNVVVDAMIGIAADFDCGVWVVHHEKKNSFDGEDKMSRARGSTVLENFVTVMENFEVKGDNEREVSWSKSRHGNAPNPVRLSWDSNAWWYSLVPTSQLEEKIMSVLRAEPDQEPMSVGEIAEETSETKHDLNPVLKKMVDNGRLRALKSLPLPGGGGTTGKRYGLVASEMDDNGGISV